MHVSDNEHQQLDIRAWLSAFCQQVDTYLGLQGTCHGASQVHDKSDVNFVRAGSVMWKFSGLLILEPNGRSTS